MSGLTGELLMFLAIALIIGAICIPGIFRNKSNNQTNDPKQKTDTSNSTPVKSKDPKSGNKAKGTGE